MSKIAVSAAKGLREQIGATHVVIFAVHPDGTQSVATHGHTRTHASEAAKAGNNLKAALGWPPESCRAVPVARTCGNCAYFVRDMAARASGWAGDYGDCQLEPRAVSTRSDKTCRHFEPKEGAR